MAYILVSEEYIPPKRECVLVWGGNLRRIPRNAIRRGNGYFLLMGESIHAEFKFYFRDEEGKRYSFDAHQIISDTMKYKTLTKSRRKRISEVVKEVAATSKAYEPEKWFKEAVLSLKI